MPSIKFQPTDASGSFITNAAAQLFVANVSNNVIGTNQIALSTGNADTGNTFRYDSTSNQYVFNFDTTPLTTGTWQLKVSLEGTVKSKLILKDKKITKEGAYSNLGSTIKKDSDDALWSHTILH